MIYSTPSARQAPAAPAGQVFHGVPVAPTLDRIIGQSPAIRAVKSLLAKIAASPASTVLLCGESGTGKGLMAEELHAHSDRAGRPFQNITCGALPETLLESELFGSERGAYTDAKQQRKGLIEVADGGTVFLDEIGEITPALQVKLLRFLEERAFKRIGGSTDIRVDVLVIAATNRNLEQAVSEGMLREDLYYRLRVLPVRVPPLRERLEDIPQLVAHFVETYNEAFRKRVRGLTRGALARLGAHRWPGNIRELKNVIERAMLLSESDVLGENDLPSMLAPAGAPHQVELPPAGLDLPKLESDLLHQALQRSGGNRSRAARLLGLSRHQIRYRLEKSARARR
ncbi:MAG TPA: sigma 54-interacting transcriptional regulator [Thermoanaerobaculia bacterium]|jgi:two-component system response regulator AtoC|nr:sigma 54-interacting transcriptional regulator [Thermoanaerobaculia bacterium]